MKKENRMSILDQAVILQDQIIPDDIPLMELADKVVRGKVQLSPQQQRMLIEMLPYIAPKLSAALLAGLLIPTTFVGHPFWKEQNPRDRANQQVHFLKNLVMLGGLLTVLAEKDC